MQRMQQILQRNQPLTSTAHSVPMSNLNLKKDQQPQTISCNSELPKVNDKRIDTLFTRFGAIYGHLWLSLYQNERLLAFAKKEWSEGLQHFDTATVKEALLKYRGRSTYPPTLPQFTECCKDIRKRKETYISAVRTHERSHPEIAKKHIQAMLNFLKK